MCCGNRDLKEFSRLIKRLKEPPKRIDLARALLKVSTGGRAAPNWKGTGPKKVSAMPAATTALTILVGCYHCVAHAHCAQECPIS
jgi:hypothetical protein